MGVAAVEMAADGSPPGGRSLVKTWWWVPFAVLAVLFVKAWIVATMVSGAARTAAAEAADIPVERVEMDGLNVRLTGFTTAVERNESVAAVTALDSSRHVEGVLEPASPDEDESALAPESTGNGSAANAVTGRRAQVEEPAG